MKADWSQLKTLNTPLARSSHGVSVIGDVLYMFGGEHSARQPLDSTLNSLNLKSQDKTWQKVKTTGTPPLPRFGHSQAVLGNRIFIFGGRMGTAVDEKLLDDLFVFDTETAAWFEVKAEGGSPPSARCYQRMVSWDNCLYVFGGCPAEGRVADLHSFDTNTKTWTRLQDSGR